jgi:hypothetical protein
MIAPHLWIARRNGTSFSKAKCVRETLRSSNQVATLEVAKAEFEASWKQWKA